MKKSKMCTSSVDNYRCDHDLIHKSLALSSDAHCRYSGSNELPPRSVPSSSRPLPQSHITGSGNISPLNIASSLGLDAVHTARHINRRTFHIRFRPSGTSPFSERCDIIVSSQDRNSPLAVDKVHATSGRRVRNSTRVEWGLVVSVSASLTQT